MTVFAWTPAKKRALTAAAIAYDYNNCAPVAVQFGVSYSRALERVRNGRRYLSEFEGVAHELGRLQSALKKYGGSAWESYLATLPIDPSL